RVDAAFIRTPSREVDGLVVVAIIDEEMLIALPARHPLAVSASLALEALSREPFILFPRASSPELYDNIVLACGRAGFAPHVVQQAPEIASTLNLIAAGEGVSIVPASMRHMQSQAVAYRAFSATPRGVPWALHIAATSHRRRCAILQPWRAALRRISAETPLPGPARLAQQSNKKERRKWPRQHPHPPAIWFGRSRQSSSISP